MRKPVFVICEQQRCRSACTLRSLTSAFVVRCLDSIIPILAKSEISRLKLASVVEQAGLSLAWSQIPKHRFSHDVAHLKGTSLYIFMRPWWTQESSFNKSCRRTA